MANVACRPSLLESPPVPGGLFLGSTDTSHLPTGPNIDASGDVSMSKLGLFASPYGFGPLPGANYVQGAPGTFQGFDTRLSSMVSPAGSLGLGSLSQSGAAAPGIAAVGVSVAQASVPPSLSASGTPVAQASAVPVSRSSRPPATPAI